MEGGLRKQGMVRGKGKTKTGESGEAAGVENPTTMWATLSTVLLLLGRVKNERALVICHGRGMLCV